MTEYDQSYNQCRNLPIDKYKAYKVKFLKDFDIILDASQSKHLDSLNTIQDVDSFCYDLIGY